MYRFLTRRSNSLQWRRDRVSSATRIAALLALTGPEAPYARQLQHAIGLAFEDAVRPCDLVVADDHADAARAAEAARQLASDPSVIAVVGPMNSWTCESAGVAFAATALPHITPSASNAALAEQGWPTFFRACPADDVQARVLAAVADRFVGAGRVGAVDDGSSFAAPLCAGFLAAAAVRGLAPLRRASVAHARAGALERAADAIARDAPDAVLIAGLEEPCQQAARALRARGVGAVFLGTDGIKPSRALRVDGFPAPWLTNSATDARYQAPAFHARMLQLVREHHSIYTVEAWEAAGLLLDILRRGARTRKEVHAALANRARGDGPLAFDQRGERLDPRIGLYVDEESGPRFVGDSADLLGSL